MRHIMTGFSTQVSHLLTVYFGKDGSQIDRQKSPSSRCSVQRNVLEPIQGIRRGEVAPHKGHGHGESGGHQG